MTESAPLTDPSPMAIVRSDHGCFGCGAENPIGLHLRFSTNAEGVQASFIPAPEHQGFENVVHGGIISSVLDEAMAWATAAAGYWAVTAEISVRFRRPLGIAEPTTARAIIMSTRNRLITTTATLSSDLDGAQIASATATFMRVSQETETAWKARYLQPQIPDSDRG